MNRKFQPPSQRLDSLGFVVFVLGVFFFFVGLKLFCRELTGLDEMFVLGNELSSKGLLFPCKTFAEFSSACFGSSDTRQESSWELSSRWLFCCLCSCLASARK